MRKKYFLAKLAIYGFLTLGAATTFVGCKDYDGDITDLQTQIDDNKADYTSVLTEKLAAVNTQITTLQGTQTALQATVATAQTAANAAKTSADAAAAAAAAAQLAAAQAKLDAINTAASALATVKTALETRISTLDGKFAALQESVSKGATKDELTAINANLVKEIANAKSSIEAELVDVSAKISAVDSKYNTLAATVETLATKSEVEAALVSLKTELAALYLQQATFNDYKTIVTTQFADLQTQIDVINGKVDANTTKIATLETKITELSAQLTAAIATAKTEAINEAVNKALAADAQQAVTLEAMWKAYVATSLDNYVDKATYEAAVAAFNDELETLSAAITTNLNTMNAIFSHRLTSMAFIPEFYTGGIPTIIFSTLYYTDLDQQAPKTTLSTSMHSQAKYRMNPNGVMLSDINDFVFTGETAETKGLGTDPAAPISVAGQKLENGVLTLDVTKTANFVATRSANTKFDIVSLKATLADKALTSAEKEAGTCVAVYSDYVKATEVSLDGCNLNIAKNGSLDYHYALSQALAQDRDYETSFVYNGQLDLKKAVASCYLIDGTTHSAFNEKAYGLCYRFAMAGNAYNKVDNGVTTNQQDFASVSSDGIMTARVYQDNPLAAAAGRTPIVKVELVDASNHVVKRAFIKVKITANKRADIVVCSNETLTLGCADDQATFKINAERMNREVYNVIPMTHAQAMDTYTPDGTSVTGPVTAVPQIVNVGIDGVLSTEVHWVVPQSQFELIPAEGKEFVATLRCIPRYPDSDLPDLLFKFTVKVNKPAISIVGKELTYWDAQQAAFKVNVAVPGSGPFAFDSNNCIYSADLRNAFNKNSAGEVELANKPDCGCLKFKIVGTNPSTATGISINGNIITFNRSAANTDALAELEKTTLFATVKAYYEWNGNTVDLMTFNVQFIKPLGLSVVTDGNFTDGATGGSIINYNYFHNNGSIDVLVKDWREVSLTPTSQLWGFYGLDGVWFDTAHAKTNLKLVGGNLVPTEGWNAGELPTDVLLSQYNHMGVTNLKYVNNGTALTCDYELFIPVTITHKWGTLKTTLNVPVKRLPSVGTRK